MANVKKFVYVTTAAKWEENKSYILESTGKWYKSIVFRADTNEIYNRGKAYGLSVADAQRITDLESAVAVLNKAKADLDASKSIKHVGAVLYTYAEYVAIEGNEGVTEEQFAALTEAQKTKTAASYEVDLTTILAGDNKTIDVTNGVASINANVGIKYTEATDTKAATLGLYDKDGALLGSEIEVSKIVGNGILNASSYDKETGKLTLTFNTDDGKNNKAVEIDLAAMLDINDMSIAEASQIYLEVDLTGGENSQAVFSVKTKALNDASRTLYTYEEYKALEGNSEVTEDAFNALTKAQKTKATVTGVADALDVKEYVDAKVADKNVSAEGETGDNALVSASASDNKVTVASTQKLKDAVASAESALQTVEGSDYVSVTDKADNKQTVSVKTQALGTAVGMEKKYTNNGGTSTITETEYNALEDKTGYTPVWVAANGTLATEGLVLAKDVAKEIADNEAVVAAALNDHESRIETLEAVDPVVTTVGEKTSGQYVTIADKATAGSNDHAYEVGVTTAVYDADSNAFTTAGLVDSAVLASVITDIKQDIEDSWEEL